MHVDIELLKSQHAAIIAANEELQGLWSETYIVASDRLGGVRSKLARLIAEHLAAENEQLHAPLQARKLTGSIPAYEQIAAETRELRLAYSKHISEWRLSAIERDWVGYVCAAQAFSLALLRVMGREERELFPLAVSLLAQAK